MKCGRLIIELVAGSRVTGIEKKSDGFHLAFTSDKDALDNCVTNLRAIVERCRHLEDAVVWAIELEPGPLFTVRDWATLKALCDKLANDPILNTNVGVNLDISHWRMGQSGSPRKDALTAAMVRDSSVFRQIVHAHISGHDRKAHFGDLPLDIEHAEREYFPWLALLRHRAAFKDRNLPFSGYVSLELEACSDPAMARATMRNLALVVARER